MGEVIQFIPKSERERIRLIREARAIYDSIFPPADLVSERFGKVATNNARASHAVRAGDVHRSEGMLPS